MSDESYDFGELVVIQHETDVPLAALEPVLEGRAHDRPYRLANLGAGDDLPGVSNRTRGVLVLGGSMGLPDDDRPDWIDDELELLRASVKVGVPVLGICLGSQLLAEALGGEVRRRDAPEVGFFALHPTLGAEEDEVFAGWPAGGGVFMSHEDQVTKLPEGAVEMLHGSDGVPAWRAGDGRSYGVQFHPELTTETLETWAAKDRLKRMMREAGRDEAALVEEFKRRERFLKAVGVSMVGRWLDGVVGADDPVER